MVLLVTPKGWTGPAVVDGVQVEGTWRAHQVPLAATRENDDAPRPARGVDAVLPARGAVRRRRPAGRVAACARPRGSPADERQPARERRPAAPTAGAAGLPRATPSRCPRRAPRCTSPPASSAATSSTWSATTPTTSGIFGPDETASNRLDAVYEVTDKVFAGRDPPRRRAPRPQRPGDGDPLRAHLPGLARGLPAHRPARPLQLLRGVHPHRRLDAQPAREVAQDDA